MKGKKIHLLIVAVLAAVLLVFVGWGFFKTTVKLTREKPMAAKTEVPIAEEPEQPSAEPADIKARISAIIESIKNFLQRLNLRLPGPGQTKKTAETDLDAALNQGPAEPIPIMVRTLEVKMRDFNDTLPVMGSVKAKTEIPLKFETNGVIQKIHFREGERIRKGEAVASIDPTDIQHKLAYAKNKLNSAIAGYNSAQKKLEIQQKLYDVGAIIKAKLEEAQLETESSRYQVETVRSELDLAENEMRKTVIYAGKDCVMGKREAEEGEFVTPQDKVCSIYEIGEVYVEVGVVERDIDKLKVGQAARVFVDAYPARKFEGFIENIYPVIEGKSRTLTVKIKVPNEESLLLPGMFCRAEIMIVSLKNAIIIPTICIVPSEKGKNIVPVIPPHAIKKIDEEIETGLVQLQTVSLGYATSDFTQILEGIKPNDLVVLEAQGEIKMGTRVRITSKEDLNL